MNNSKAKKGIIAGVIVAMLLIGGSVTALFILKKNPKEQYFYAEYKTMEQGLDSFKERYENEFAWNETTQESPTEHEFEISPADSAELLDVDPAIADLFESSGTKIVVATDPKKGEAKVDLSVNALDVKIDGIVAYLTTEKLLLSLPFQEELLQLNDKDFGNLMRNIDPSYIGTEKLGLENINSENTAFSDRNIEYLKEAYVMGFIKALPKEAFKEQGEEEVKVEGKKIKAQKVTMTLTEKQIKEVLTKMLEKAKDDKELEKIIVKLIDQSGGEALESLDIDLTKELDVAFKDMIDDVKKLSMPDGLTSSIWVDGDIIVKRDFQTVIEDDEIKITGTQLVKKDKQVWDYELSAGYLIFEFKGDLALKDNKITDKITILADDEVGVIYEGKEELDKDTRTFSRVFSTKEDYDTIGVNWEGTATYEKDQMSSEHNVSIFSEGEEAGIDLYKKGKSIKSVDMGKDKKAVNVGEMDQSELDEYLNDELIPNAQKWIAGIYLKLAPYFE